jgi:hypothetical protein
LTTSAKMLNYLIYIIKIQAAAYEVGESSVDIFTYNIFNLWEISIQKYLGGS